MIIKLSAQFHQELDDIVGFIAVNNAIQAIKFYNNIISAIGKTTDHPLSFRKSSLFNNENIRELIFKGYVVAFEINTAADKIIILGIFSSNIWNQS